MKIDADDLPFAKGVLGSNAAPFTLRVLGQYVFIKLDSGEILLTHADGSFGDILSFGPQYDEAWRRARAAVATSQTDTIEVCTSPRGLAYLWAQGANSPFNNERGYAPEGEGSTLQVRIPASMRDKKFTLVVVPDQNAQEPEEPFKLAE